MMKNMKKIFAILATVVLIASLVVVPCAAETLYEQDGFIYARSSSTTADLYGRESTDPDLVIPKEFSDYYVTNIADSAFKNDQSIETVTFAQASLLERIGFYAFKDCENLAGEINFTGRINTIGISAFENCRSLETVVFSSYVTAIPDQCFYNCVSLSDVRLSNTITSISKFAFGNCTTLESIIIPKTVTDINPTAFSGCDNIVIKCYTDSYAHQYAVDNDIEFVLLDAPEPTEPPTEPPTDEPTEEPTTSPVEITFMLGDADGDGEISIMDATTIQRILVDLDEDEDGMKTLRGTVVEGEDLNITHATKIQRFIADFEIAEPIGEEVTVVI